MSSTAIEVSETPDVSNDKSPEQNNVSNENSNADDKNKNETTEQVSHPQDDSAETQQQQPFMMAEHVSGSQKDSSIEPHQNLAASKTKQMAMKTRSRYTVQNRGHTMHQMANVRIYEPTYRLDSNFPFNPKHVEYIVQKYTKDNVHEFMSVYKSDNATKFCKELSQEIRFRIKLQHFDRYRLVVFVQTIEKQHQTVCMKVGFIWDYKRDLWTHFQHETKTFIVTVTVFGVYWD